jgi:GTP cyclohydrolase I
MDAVIKPLRGSAGGSSSQPADPAASRPSRDEAEAAVKTLLAYIGDNPQREAAAS